MAKLHCWLALALDVLLISSTSVGMRHSFVRQAGGNCFASRKASYFVITSVPPRRMHPALLSARPWSCASRNCESRSASGAATSAPAVNRPSTALRRAVPVQLRLAYVDTVLVCSMPGHGTTTVRVTISSLERTDERVTLSSQVAGARCCPAPSRSRASALHVRCSASTRPS
jgi:hypothetical protein